MFAFLPAVGVSDERLPSLAAELLTLRHYSVSELLQAGTDGTGSLAIAVRAFALLTPGTYDEVAAAWLRLIGSDHLTHDDVLTLLDGTFAGSRSLISGRTMVEIGTRLRAGQTTRDVAAAVGVHHGRVGEVSSWMGVVAWRRDAQLDDAITLAEEGYSPSDLLPLWPGMPLSAARSLFTQARKVLAELAVPAVLPAG